MQLGDIGIKVCPLPWSIQEIDNLPFPQMLRGGNGWAVNFTLINCFLLEDQNFPVITKTYVHS